MRPMPSHSTGWLPGCSTTSSVARSVVPSARTSRVETGTGRPVSSEAVNSARWMSWGPSGPIRGQGERHVGASRRRDLLDADGGRHPLRRRPPRARRQQRRGGGRDHRQRDEDRAHVPGRSHRRQLGTAQRSDSDEQRTTEHNQPVQAPDMRVIHVVGPHPHRHPDHRLGTNTSDDRRHEEPQPGTCRPARQTERNTQRYGGCGRRRRDEDAAGGDPGPLA